MILLLLVHRKPQIGPPGTHTHCCPRAQALIASGWESVARLLTFSFLPKKFVGPWRYVVNMMKSIGSQHFMLFSLVMLVILLDFPGFQVSRAPQLSAFSREVTAEQQTSEAAWRSSCLGCICNCAVASEHNRGHVFTPKTPQNDHF